MVQRLKQAGSLQWRGQECPLSPGLLLCHKLSPEMPTISLFVEQKPTDTGFPDTVCVCVCM